MDDLFASLNQKHRPATSYTVKVADRGRFGPLLAPPSQHKPGPLTSGDYESGYLSDEGEKLRSAIRKVAKDTQPPNPKKGKAPRGGTDEPPPAKRQATKRSRSGKEIVTGAEQETSYYGTPVNFRVDFTQSGSGEYVPHARILVGSSDISTKDAAQVATDIARENTSGAKDFVLGFNPVFSFGSVSTPARRGRKPHRTETPPERTRSASHSAGLQMRALVRGSNVFSPNDAPVLDGYQMSQVRTPQDVSLLFHDPAFNTGRMGSQNSSQAATAEFNAFEEFVATRKTSASHKTRAGTDLDQVPAIRKASAINASFPKETPLFDIEKLRPKKN
ncbi:hypothetical protein ACLBKS_03225 [Hylemonella sp. W303a]|uniref:hypothetical protein n=1 Tax=Hylemonella sp. W303a TaxID=3389873 RepID=UPI00396B30FD